MQCTSPGQMRHPTTRLWLQYACGQCTNCRITKQSSWTLRNLLELQTAPSAQFWTLTLDKQGLKHWEENPTRTMFKTFYRRLRQYESRHGNKTPIRFYGCFERGTLSGRPHFHLLLYNLDKSRLLLPHENHTKWEAQYTRHWPHGHVDVGRVTPQSIRYVTDYIMKFNPLNEKDASIPLRTTRPAIGYYGLWHVMASAAQRSLILPSKPAYLQIDNRKYPLDQWTRNQWEIMRKKLKIKYEYAPEPMDRKLDALAYREANDTCPGNLDKQFRINCEIQNRMELQHGKTQRRLTTIQKKAALLQAISSSSQAP